MKKLAIIITHPIQYYTPIFKLLALECKLKVFFTWGQGGVREKFDHGFGRLIAWDLPLLDGYEYELMNNISKNPGSHHSKGIINPDLIQKVEAFSPNAILVYGYMYRSHHELIKHFKGKVTIWFRGDSTLLNKQSGLRALVKKIYLTWIYSYIDKAFYVGANNKAYFKNFGLKENQLLFAPHAIDNVRFSEDKKAKSIDLRRKLGILDEELLILFAGKLERQKNPDLLLDAFINIARQNIDTPAFFEEKKIKRTAVHLLFVGNGILESQIKEKARIFNEQITSYSSITGKVHFLDFQNQTLMPTIYQMCDIFCLPSKSETWGLAVNEAMAAGKAIIVSDQVGCAIDLVNDGVNGYVFRSNDAIDLHSKIMLIINDPNLRETFGKKSREIIKNWTFEAQVKQFITSLNAEN